MTTMNLTSASGSQTTVLVVRETPKAILVKGNAIDADGIIADWFQFDLVHSFLFHAPYRPAA